MKDCSRRFVLLILANILLVNTFFCTCLTALAGNNVQNQEKRTIRVTTGIEQVQGWEQGLIQSNPNLARWHWDPIYSYKQGYANVSPTPPKLNNVRTGGKVPAIPGKPAFSYVVPPAQDSRPNHIPFSERALSEVQARYSQPSKPHLPSAQPKHEENVSAHLSNKQTQAMVISPTTVATYGKPYAMQEKLDTSLKYSSQKASVYGQLVNAKQKVRYNEAGFKKQKGSK